MTAEDHAEGRRLDAEVLAANEAQRAANARYETARKALAAVIWHSSRSSAPSRWARRRDLRIQRRLAGGAAQRVLGERDSMRWARWAPALDGSGFDVVEVDPCGAYWVVWHGWTSRPTTPRMMTDRLPSRHETREEAIEAAIAWLDGRQEGDE